MSKCKIIKVKWIYICDIMVSYVYPFCNISGRSYYIELKRLICLI